MNNSSSNRNKRLARNSLYILGLFLLPPIGLFFVLRSTWTKRNKIIASILAAVWTIFIAFAVINAPPTVTVNNLERTNNQPVEESSITLEGTVTPGATLEINGEIASTNSDGSFRHDVELAEGDNEIFIKAYKGDNVTEETYHVYRLTQEEIDKREAEKKEQEKAELEAIAKVEEEKARQEAEIAKAEAEEAKRKAEEEARKNAPKTSFGDGIFLVGEDIKAGTYKTSGGSYCYYERLSGTSGTFDEIITNGTPSGQAIITIPSTDKAFSSQGCGTWVLR